MYFKMSSSLSRAVHVDRERIGVSTDSAVAASTLGGALYSSRIKLGIKSGFESLDQALTLVPSTHRLRQRFISELKYQSGIK